LHIGLLRRFAEYIKPIIHPYFLQRSQAEAIHRKEKCAGMYPISPALFRIPLLVEGAVPGDVVKPIHDFILPFIGLSLFPVVSAENLFRGISSEETLKKRTDFFHKNQLPFIIKVGENSVSSDTQSVFERG
jgi:hypothetical protein